MSEVKVSVRSRTFPHTTVGRGIHQSLHPLLDSTHSFEAKIKNVNKQLAKKKTTKETLKNCINLQSQKVVNTRIPKSEKKRIRDSGDAVSVPDLAAQHQQKLHLPYQQASGTS
jgi:hypothetical protein